MWNADCLQAMKLLPDKCVDLTITSPPYNVGKNNMTKNKYGDGDALSHEEYLLWTKNILDELVKKEKV